MMEHPGSAVPESAGASLEDATTTTAQPKAGSDNSQEPSFIEREAAAEQMASEVWQKISELALDQNYEAAFQLALKEGDDMYLLKLLQYTRPALAGGLRDIGAATSKEVLKRINNMTRGNLMY